MVIMEPTICGPTNDAPVMTHGPRMVCASSLLPTSWCAHLDGRSERLVEVLRAVHWCIRHFS